MSTYLGFPHWSDLIWWDSQVLILLVLQLTQLLITEHSNAKLADVLHSQKTPEYMQLVK